MNNPERYTSNTERNLPRAIREALGRTVRLLVEHKGRNMSEAATKRDSTLTLLEGGQLPNEFLDSQGELSDAGRREYWKLRKSGVFHVRDVVKRDPGIHVIYREIRGQSAPPMPDLINPPE